MIYFAQTMRLKPSDKIYYQQYDIVYKIMMTKQKYCM